MKYLIVEMSDKTQWAIPAMLIAKNRADYIIGDVRKGLGEYQNIHEEEVAYAMSDEYEITDWAANNMDWKDVCSQAIQLKAMPSINYHKDWINAPKSVKELNLEKVER